jgi:hypothetical protein
MVEGSITDSSGEVAGLEILLEVQRNHVRLGFKLDLRIEQFSAGC